MFRIVTATLLTSLLFASNAMDNQIKVVIKSDNLPPTYIVIIKEFKITWEVVDFVQMAKEKRTTPTGTDTLFKEESSQTQNVTIKYSSKGPEFPNGNSLVFSFPNKVAPAPKGMVTTLGFPLSYEIYDGNVLIRKSDTCFQIPLNATPTREVFLFIKNAGKSKSGSINVGIGILPAGIDPSMLKAVPRS